MSKFNRVIIVALALLVLTAASSFAEGTHPLYGTKGLFRTFSADTIASDGTPSIGVTLFSLYGWGTQLDEDYDLVMNPHMGLTIAPIKYVEGAFHASAVTHVREDILYTNTYIGGMSDMNWALKGHFADQEKAWASFATLVYMDFSVGDDVLDDPNTRGDETLSFTAEGENNIGMMGLVSRKFDFGSNTALDINFNAGYLVRNGQVQKEIAGKGVVETLERPDALTYGLGFGVTPGTDMVTLMFEATGMMNMAYESIDTNTTPSRIVAMKDTNLELTGGVRFNGGDVVHFGLGGSYKLNDSWGPYSGPDYRFFFQGSIDIPLLPGDRDGDGIRDSKDRCPDDPEDFDGFEDSDGCPDLDNDKDGIPDAEDQCPNEPEDFDGFEDSDGCPDPDNDGDGILDVDDKCPNEPENFNGIDDEDGCPDEKPKPEITRFTLEGLKFKPNSAELVPGTYASLEKAGEMLREYPEISVVIEGHAASTGRPDFEASLSQERADSIKKFMIGTYGVDSGRIKTVGYGSTKPIGDNSNEAGRRMNRRIEFVVE